MILPVKHSISSRIPFRKGLIFAMFPLFVASLTDAGAATPDPTARLFLFRSPKSISYYSFLSLQEWYVHTNIWANLTRLDRQSQIQGDLATQWEVRDGGKEYRFKLDTNRKWSDGTPITTAQVHRSLVAATMKRNGKILAHLMRGGPDEEAVKKAITLEDEGTTLVLRLNHPQPKLLHHLTRAEFGIVDLESLGADGVLTPQTKTSGDYRIEANDDAALTLEMNLANSPESPRARGPKRVIFKKIANHAEALALIRKGSNRLF